MNITRILGILAAGFALVLVEVAAVAGYYEVLMAVDRQNSSIRMDEFRKATVAQYATITDSINFVTPHHMPCAERLLCPTR